MKTIFFKYVLAISCLMQFVHDPANAQSNSNAIVGEWLTKTSGGHVIIYEQNGKYFGKLMPKEYTNALDLKNPDPHLRGRKIMGLVMLQDFVFDGTDTWKDGSIYDANEGKTYSCKLSVSSAGELKVRGYVGISLFGKTELWTRVKN